MPRAEFVFSRIFRELDFNEECKKISRIFASSDVGYVYLEKEWYLDLENIIKNSKVNYLVVDKKSEFYDEEKEIYNFLYLKMQEYEYDNIYENNSFVVFAYH